jgi:GxxExxY protein
MDTLGGRLLHRELTDRILNCAVEVHRTLGPGLLESAYRICLARELELNGVPTVPEVPIPLVYKGMAVKSAYRADLIVDCKVLVELKATDKLLPIHDAQLLTSLRLCGLRVGLLLNFNVTSLRQGMRRFIR